MRLFLIALSVLLWAGTAQGQTRFYFNSDTAPGVSPAFNGTVYQRSDQAVRRNLVLTTPGASAMATGTFTEDTGDTPPSFVLGYQFVKCGLEAQTIDGTIKGQIRAFESNATANTHVSLRVAKSASDGSSVTELLAITSADSGGDPNEISSTALTNRSFKNSTESAGPHNLASTAVSAGDCLIVEVGFRETSTNDTRTVQLRVGEADATDLPEDDTTTNDNRPWVEFSDAITFQTGAAAPKSLMLLGVGGA